MSEVSTPAATLRGRAHPRLGQRSPRRLAMSGAALAAAAVLLFVLSRHRATPAVAVAPTLSVQGGAVTLAPDAPRYLAN